MVQRDTREPEWVLGCGEGPVAREEGLVFGAHVKVVFVEHACTQAVSEMAFNTTQHQQNRRREREGETFVGDGGERG
jgi:hypothetical protein